MSSERRKARVGTVIQDRMDKTVVVAVEWRRAPQALPQAGSPEEPVLRSR